MVENDVYRKEILDFLQTVTIKFKLFADVMEKRMREELGIIVERPEDNPYYQNLCGMYSPLDTDMFITAVETGEQVKFSTDLKITHPKTFALYKVPSEEFSRLCETYPNQVGLIKSIVYPVENIALAISAPNFTVLAGDTTLLHQNERESLMVEMDRVLRYIENRWYIADYIYEGFYPATFMGLVWSILPQALLAQRIRNIRTPQVHPFHIWEYLDSKGLRSYRDILNDKQALFLYRNMEYISQNKGTKRTLEILAENLLKDLQVKLVGKMVLQQTATRASECITVPEFLSDNVVNYTTAEGINEGSFESMGQILSRIEAEGYFPNLDAEVVERMTTRFGEASSNVVPTRLLEFEKSIMDTTYEKLLLQFLFDTMVYQWYLGNLQYKINFTDPNTNIPIELTFGEVLALFQYVHLKESGEGLTVLPIHACINNAYVLVRPNKSAIQKWIYVDGIRYRLDTYVDVDKVLNEIPFHSGPYESREDFVTKTAQQFRVLVTHIERLRSNGGLLYHEAFNTLYKYLTVDEFIDIQLVDAPNYQVWIDSTPKISQLLSAYEKLPDKVIFYKDLCDILLEQVVPMQDPIFEEFTAFNKDKSAMYTGLKRLFIQLTSYRLTFLETNRRSITFITPPHLVIGTTSGTDTVKGIISAVGQDISSKFREYGGFDLSALDDTDILRVDSKDRHTTVDPTPLVLDTGKFGEVTYFRDYHSVEIVDRSVYTERSVTVLDNGAETYEFTTPIA